MPSPVRLFAFASALAVPLLAACTVVLPDVDGASAFALDACAMECNGCCDGDGNCLAGTERDACGWGGARCTTCGDDQPCAAAAGGGECAACSQLTCDVAGTADDQCGRAGQLCVACPGFCDVQPLGGGICG